MRKIEIMLAVLLASMAVAFVACKKTSMSEAGAESADYKMMSGSMDGYSVSEDGYLHFENEEIFDALMTELANKSDDELNEWEEMLGYNSSYSYYGIADIDEDDSLAVSALSDEFRNKGFVDPFLLRIINKDGIIRIGDYLFKLQIDDGYILQMYAKDIAHAYDDFKNGIFKRRFMNQLVNEHLDGLEEDENVFDLLAGGPVGLQPLSMSVRDIFGNRDVLTEPTSPVPGGGHNPYQCRLISAYQNSIVYKSWIVKFKYFIQGSGGLINHATEINIEYPSSWAEYKYFNSSALHTTAPTSSEVEYSTGARHKLKWRIYEAYAGRRLGYRYGHIYWRYWDHWTETYKTIIHYAN